MGGYQLISSILRRTSQRLRDTHPWLFPGISETAGLRVRYSWGTAAIYVKNPKIACEYAVSEINLKHCNNNFPIYNNQYVIKTASKCKSQTGEATHSPWRTGRSRRPKRRKETLNDASPGQRGQPRLSFMEFGHDQTNQDAPRAPDHFTENLPSLRTGTQSHLAPMLNVGASSQSRKSDGSCLAFPSALSSEIENSNVLKVRFSLSLPPFTTVLQGCGGGEQV